VDVATGPAEAVSCTAPHSPHAPHRPTHRGLG
jgi:hypothetical protein